LSQTFRETGAIGLARKLFAAARMGISMSILRRRTNKSVGAYFDLITDDARMFYGDNFHFGYFITGNETLSEAHDNHTDLVAKMAGITSGSRVLDIGCGICAPATRIASAYDAKFTCINISAEQVRQAKRLVKEQGLTHAIDVLESNAFSLEFKENSFDSVLCLEVAGDICVNEKQKNLLVCQMKRVLKGGGRVGFSDLVFHSRPTRAEERAMRTILYHQGEELITNWPKIFSDNGFVIKDEMDILPQTTKTWAHSISVYEDRFEEVCARYGKKIARSTVEQLRQLPEILGRHAAFVVMSAEKIC
jgi:27-O-demethylrifamycin SV methyltransferase